MNLEWNIKLCLYLTKYVITLVILRMKIVLATSDSGLEGARNLFSGMGVQLGFLKSGACKLILSSEREGLLTEYVQIWSLSENLCKNWSCVELFPNSGSFKLILELFFIFLNGAAKYRNGVKRGPSGPHIPIAPSRSGPSIADHKLPMSSINNFGFALTNYWQSVTT